MEKLINTFLEKSYTYTTGEFLLWLLFLFVYVVLFNFFMRSRFFERRFKIFAIEEHFDTNYYGRNFEALTRIKEYIIFGIVLYRKRVDEKLEYKEDNIRPESALGTIIE